MNGRKNWMPPGWIWALEELEANLEKWLNISLSPRTGERVVSLAAVKGPLLPDFKPWRSRYESVNYGISNYWFSDLKTSKFTKKCMASGRRVGQRPDCHTFLCKFWHFQMAVSQWKLVPRPSRFETSMRVDGFRSDFCITEKLKFRVSWHMNGRASQKSHWDETTFSRWHNARHIT